MILKNENKIKSESAKRAFAFLLGGRNVGAFAPNPDQGTFCKKSLGTSKTFAKTEGCVLGKFFGLPFL